MKTAMTDNTIDNAPSKTTATRNLISSPLETIRGTIVVVAALSTVSWGEERQTSNAPNGTPLVTHEPLHTASLGAVCSIYPQ
jgi:hypothetical protein